MLYTLFLEHNWLFWSPAQIELYVGLLCDISTWLNYLHHLLFDNVFIHSFIHCNLFMNKNSAFADEYIDIIGQQNGRYHFLTPYSQPLIHFVAVKGNYSKYRTYKFCWVLWQLPVCYSSSGVCHSFWCSFIFYSQSYSAQHNNTFPTTRRASYEVFNPLTWQFVWVIVCLPAHV